MKLSFVIDKNYLIVHALSCVEKDSFSSLKYRRDIINFQNYAWRKSKKYYNFLTNKLKFFPDELTEKNIYLFTKELFSLLKQLSSSKEFKKIYSQTEKYLKFCEKQWDKNCEITEQIIKELTGFRLNKNFIIYITHPSLRNGRSIGKNRITWGHNEDWPNYATVYLWHEILHSYFEYSDLNHAVIELITDEELRSRLNDNKYPPFIGHKRLENIKKKLLPRWRKYLKSNKKSILKFHKSIKIK